MTINQPKPGLVTKNSEHIRRGQCQNCNAPVEAIDWNPLPKLAYVLCAKCDHVTILAEPQQPEAQSQA